MYNGRREFRAGPGRVVAMVLATALFAGVTFILYRTGGWGWLSVAMAGVTVFAGLGAILESLLLRIQLTEDALIVTDLRGRRRYEIASIEGIEEARGVPPALRLKDGRWVKLPSVGSNVGNSVRAWLKR